VRAGNELIDVVQPGIDRRFGLDHEGVEGSAAKPERRGWPRFCHFVNPQTDRTAFMVNDWLIHVMEVDNGASCAARGVGQGEVPHVGEHHS
jgi:hypothetical protein